ncbi:MAG: AfsA-related hotdog domain-containing protein [Proteobacteria bacterium]|nr:AfsA-related hotdog domain-containing protein [Pseudomonadota bacterium]
MEKKCYFVVGDKFNEFAEGKDVLTLNQLKSLTNLPVGLMNNNAVLILGQGVQEDEIHCILRKYENSFEVIPFLETTDLRRVLDRAPSDMSHKKLPFNTLLGVPRRLGDNEFQMSLNIDERCELMGDHQSGQHVQGMILVEAFRQSFLVVTEAFFPFNNGKTYFVINEMNTAFQGFLFPLPANVNYRILESDSNERRARYKVAMSAIQNNIVCATAEVAFTVYPASNIAEKEAELAHEITISMLALLQKSALTPSAHINNKPKRELVSTQ